MVELKEYEKTQPVVCKYCGRVMGYEIRKKTTPEEETPPKEETGNYCPDCGSELDKEYECPNCGYKKTDYGYVCRQCEGSE